MYESSDPCYFPGFAEAYRRRRMSRLEPDILLEIFRKLPLKPLFRLKLVCKAWRSLISKPYSLSKYNPNCIPKHPPNLVMIRRYPNSDRTYFPVYTFEVMIGSGNIYVPPAMAHPHRVHDNFHLESRVELLGSCNGLVGLYNMHGDFCLYNPITKEKKVVSVLICNDHQAQELCLDSQLKGLCHDPITDEYKAVILSFNARFCVVSFKHGSCNSKTQPGFLEDLLLNRGRFRAIVKGVPHWLCRIMRKNKFRVVYFDQLAEEFRAVELPESWSGRWGFGLGDLGGQLTVGLALDHQSRTRDVQLEVWALKEYGNVNSWSVLFVMNNTVPMSLLAWMPDEEVLIEFIDDKRFMIYNIRNRSWRTLDQRMSMGRSSFYTIASYVPSLVSPI